MDHLWFKAALLAELVVFKNAATTGGYVNYLHNGLLYDNVCGSMFACAINYINNLLLCNIDWLSLKVADLLGYIIEKIPTWLFVLFATQCCSDKYRVLVAMGQGHPMWPKRGQVEINSSYLHTPAYTMQRNSISGDPTCSQGSWKVESYSPTPWQILTS